MTETITGKNYTGFVASGNGKETFKAFEPAANSFLEGDFHYATTEELDHALALAEKATLPFKQLSLARRAEFLDAIAEEIMNLGDTLIDRCSRESGLPVARITGERARTCGQLQLFAKLLRDGWYVDARIDKAMPERTPLPKPDIRRMLIPIGPVAVFGASNFPLAFSTAGGDTASALAAGCPVIVKAHSSHPGTNELVASAIIKAAQRTNMPEGVFSTLYLGHADAVKLVTYPAIKAVGFTGSRRAGMLLFNAAVSRPEPIPVYAEMSSINPFIVLESAFANEETLAKNLTGSITLGVGQFCTNPGLILMVDSPAAQSFLKALAAQLKATAPATMLNRNICKSYAEGVATLQSHNEVSLLAQADTEPVEDKHQARPVIHTVKGSDFLNDKKFGEEIFGPASLVVLCSNEKELLDVLESMEGQLTATIHSGTSEAGLINKVTEIISQKAGRLIFGGYPTGVEVCHAMVHGGPFPATSDGRSTSVGTAAIFRFLRPVAFQDFPNEFLPEELKNENPLGLLRLVDNEWTKAGW